ncbi:MAG TPA: hypothetical protein VN962_01685 [Polyangia bacterium]|nr:hypothetical protein [Polyangia bacterium]
MTTVGTEGAVLMAVVTVTIGCANIQVGGTLPGRVDLWRPPNAPAATGATLAPPAPEPTLIVSPGVLGGTGVRETAGIAQAEAGLGFELGLYWTRVTPDETAIAGHAPGFSRPRAAVGLNLGWTPAELRSGRRDHQPTTYVELQGRQDFWGLAFGVALSPGEWSRARSGVQLTPLCGPFYLRLQSTFDGSLAIELGVAIKIPVLILFGA